MTDCLNGTMRDRLPLAALGTLSAADEASLRAHLSGCAACRAELRAIESSRRLLDAAAPAVDTAAIVAALPAPRLRVLAADPVARPKRSWMPPSYVAAAASILIVASLAMPYLHRTAAGPAERGAPDTSVAALPGGTGTTSAPAPAPAVSAGLAVDGGLSDLSDDDLNALLSALDGIEATVAAEPSTLRRAVIDDPGSF